MFNRDVQVHYIEDAHKPSRKNYLESDGLMGTDLSDTVFIGDQLLPMCMEQRGQEWRISL